MEKKGKDGKREKDEKQAKGDIDSVVSKLQSEIFNLGKAKEVSVRRSVSMVESQLDRNAEEMEVHIKEINEKHRKNVETKITHYESKINDLENQLQDRCIMIDQLKGRLEESRTAKKEALLELEESRRIHNDRIEELTLCINESKEKLVLLERERERRKSEAHQTSRLQASLEEYKEEIRNLEDKVAELDNEATEKQFTISQLETEKERLEARMESLEEKNQGLNAELAKFMESCKSKVDTEDSVRKVLEDQLSKIQKEWDETKRLLCLEQVRSQDLETQVSELHKQVGMSKVDIRYLTRTKAEVEAALAKQKEANEKLREKMSTAESDTCTLGSKLASLEIELQSLKNEMDSKNQQITSLTKTHDELSEQRVLLKNENVTLRNDLALLQLKVQESQHLNKIISDKDVIIEEKTDAIDKKSREVKKLKNGIEELKTVLKVLDDQQQEFTAQLEKQMSTAKELENINQILKNENSDIRGQLTQSRKDLNESKSLKTFMEQRLRATENENQSLESKVQQQLAFVTTSNEELASANTALTTRVNKVEAENVQLSTVIASHVKEKEQLATETRQLTNIVVNCQEENLTLKSALKETLSKAETYKEGYEKYKEICRIQEQEMSRMQVQLNTKVEQQEKLIDFLQGQLEKQEKKKKKGLLFTPKRAEKDVYTPKAGTPLSRPGVGVVTSGGKVSQALCLEQEQLVVKMLEDKRAHLRNHLENLTSSKYTPVTKQTPTLPPPRKEECVLLKEKSNTIGAGYAKSGDAKSHRFSGGGTRCERTEKCVGCPEPIYRGMSSVECEECNSYSHPSCVSVVGKTCRKFQSAISDLDELLSSQNIGDQCVHGNVNIRTDTMTAAGLRYLKIQASTLFVYASKSSTKSPIESFSLNEETRIYFSPPESDNVEPQSKIQRACTMKVETIGEDQKSKFIYMFHKQRHDMRYWIRGIERNKRTGSVMSLNAFNISTSDDEKENLSAKFSEKVLLEDQRPLKIYVNSVYWLAASKVYLLGCDDGLYSLKSVGGKPVRIHGPKAIYQIDVLHAVKYAVFIEGPTRALTTVYLGLLQSCAEAAECSSPRFNSDVVSKTKDCYILATRSKSSKDTIVAAASKNSLLICGWTTDGLVLIKQEIMKECITALLMTEHSVLFGNQSVLEIDTKTFQVEDFLDMTDESIYYVQIVNESHGSYPVAILDVTKSRGPKADESEYLICFQDIGIFVDSFGRRSRSEDILWSHVPVSFEYRHPYLYIFHFESVEVQLLNEKSYTRETTLTRVASKVGDKTTTQKVAKYQKVLPEVRFHPTVSKSSPTYVGKGSSQHGVVYFLSAVQSAKMIELSSAFAS